MSYYLHYQDDGPAGITGQDVSSTMPHSFLMRFPDEEAARHFTALLGKWGNGRRMRRITGSWDEGDVLEM